MFIKKTTMYTTKANLKVSETSEELFIKIHLPETT